MQHMLSFLLDFDLNLNIKNIQFWAFPHHYSSLIEASIIEFAPEVQEAYCFGDWLVLNLHGQILPKIPNFVNGWFNHKRKYMIDM